MHKGVAVQWDVETRQGVYFSLYWLLKYLLVQELKEKNRECSLIFCSSFPYIELNKGACRRNKVTSDFVNNIPRMEALVNVH